MVKIKITNSVSVSSCLNPILTVSARVSSLDAGVLANVCVTEKNVSTPTLKKGRALLADVLTVGVNALISK